MKAPNSRSRGKVLSILGLGSGTVIVAAAAYSLAGTPPPRPSPAPPPAPPRTTPPATPPAEPPAEAYVELFDDLSLEGQKLTIQSGADIRSLDGVPADGGVGGFEDRPASVRWNIPVGWQLVLFEHKNFEGNRLELKGTGRAEETMNLGCFTDSASSARWEHRP